MRLITLLACLCTTTALAGNNSVSPIQPFYEPSNSTLTVPIIQLIDLRLPSTVATYEADIRVYDDLTCKVQRLRQIDCESSDPEWQCLR
jgi:hypothetical protein